MAKAKTRKTKPADRPQRVQSMGAMLHLWDVEEGLVKFSQRTVDFWESIHRQVLAVRRDR